MYKGLIIGGIIATVIIGISVGAGQIIYTKEISAKQTGSNSSAHEKLNPDLYNYIQDMNPEDKIKVSIWLKPIEKDNIEKDKIERETILNKNLKLIGTRPTEDTDRTVYEEFYKKLEENKKEAIILREKPIIEYLKRHNIEVLYASRYAPVIFVELPKKRIFELEKRDDVLKIDLCRRANLEIDTAVPTIHAPFVWSEGYNGTGVKVAIVEGDRVDFENPYLSGKSFIPFGPVGSHATEVAGVVASVNSTYKGVAYDVDILSANSIIYWDFALVRATEWALSQGADILSLSFGTDNDLVMDNLDMYYDNVVWDHFRAVVKSAGNEPCKSGSGNVTSPGLGWNVITVGGIDDSDTVNWNDDSRYICSSYEDPLSPHGDRNKPEVSAVAERLLSTENKYYNSTCGSWISVPGCINPEYKFPPPYEGTSYAAPAVAGEIALLINTKWYLSYWPEVTKAIVMASAIHNTYGDIIDDKEGVGTVDSFQAYQIVKDGKFRMWKLTKKDLPKVINFTASKGERIRGVIAWSSHTSCSLLGCSDTLASDLDLEIYDPNGVLVTSSTSYDNNYEIVDFIAQMNGTYKAKIVAKRFDTDYEYVGAAKWSSKYLS